VKRKKIHKEGRGNHPVELALFLVHEVEPNYSKKRLRRKGGSKGKK